MVKPVGLAVFPTCLVPQPNERGFQTHCVRPTTLRKSLVRHALTTPLPPLHKGGNACASIVSPPCKGGPGPLEGRGPPTYSESAGVDSACSTRPGCRGSALSTQHSALALAFQGSRFPIRSGHEGSRAVTCRHTSNVSQPSAFLKSSFLPRAGDRDRHAPRLVKTKTRRARHGRRHARGGSGRAAAVHGLT